VTAEYRITYWQEIPSLVEAVAGDERVRRPLSGRFQHLIDAAAMRRGVIGTDAYLDGWRVGPIHIRQGSPGEVAAAVAAEIEGQFEEIRRGAMSSAPPGTA
jgi:hypothetical protein